MKTTIDAMKQALEALSDIPLTALHAHKINAHMNACFLLKEAIAREEAQTVEPITGSRYGSPEMCELILANLTKPIQQKCKP